jgi:hypothetical protein
MKHLTLFLAFFCLVTSCQQNQESTRFQSNHRGDKNIQNAIPVLTLGTFHFDFPNLDVVKTDDKDKIDVLSPIYQEELELIATKLEKFKPTIIVVEIEPEFQEKYDSLYQSYLKGHHKLTRSETQQIGFRLAKKLNLNRLYCTDGWGSDYEDVNQLLEGNDSISKQKFMDFFFNNPDSLLMSSRNEKRVFKTQGILAELIRINSDEILTKSLGDYLVGIFKYETPENNQFGVDFTTGWWFNRNLRIFRNIQRIETRPTDRILVIYGSGHMNLLNIFFESSPEYELKKLNDFLK